MKAICALVLLAFTGFSQIEDPGTSLLYKGKESLYRKHDTVDAERYLRQALALWEPVEPKPPGYLESLGLFGLAVEGRLFNKPEDLRTELEPMIESQVHRMLAPGYPGEGLMAARVLEVYGILLQRTGRANEAASWFARANSLRFPEPQSSSGPPAARIGNGVSAPRLLKESGPGYAEDARIAKHQGQVRVLFVVEKTGLVRDIRVLRSVGLGLDEKAVDAVRTWTFAPGQKDGSPVAVEVQLEVNFRLLSSSNELPDSPESETRGAMKARRAA